MEYDRYISLIKAFSAHTVYSKLSTNQFFEVVGAVSTVFDVVIVTSFLT